MEGAEELERAIEHLLASDVNALSDAELHARTVRVTALSSRLAAARADLVAEWHARRLWADDGSKSPGARLARECSLSPATAKAEVKRARKLATMPHVAGALAGGALSVDYVDLLAAANTATVRSQFARDESMLVNLIGPMRFVAAKQTVAYWRSSARDEVQEPFVDRQTSRRHASCDRTFHGGVHLQAFFARVPGTAVYDEVHRLERELFEADLAAARTEHGDDALAHLPRTGAQRMADAIELMARRSAAADGIGAARPLFTVLVGYETLTRRVCQLEDGTVVEPEELRPFLAEAEVERVVFDGPARVIEVGPRTRFFTGALRRAIQVRDRHCQDPSGCDEPVSRTEVDHIVEYEDGGETTQANGQLACRFHNRRKHRQKRRQQARERAGLRRLHQLRQRLAADYLTDDADDAYVDTG